MASKYTKGRMIRTLDEFYKVFQAQEPIYYEWWHITPTKHKILNYGFYQNMPFRTIVMLIEQGSFYRATKFVFVSTKKASMQEWGVER